MADGLWLIQVSVASAEFRIESFQTQLTILHSQFTTVRRSPVPYAISYKLFSLTRYVRLAERVGQDPTSDEAITVR